MSLTVNDIDFWKYIAIGSYMTIKSFSFAIGMYFAYKISKDWIKYKKEKKTK